MVIRSLARPLLAAWFIYGGVESILEPQRRAATSGPVVEPFVEPLLVPLREETGLAITEQQLVQVHGAATVVAATVLAMSKTPRTAAFTLAGLAAITAVAGAPFWRETDLEERSRMRGDFMKNISLLGGTMIAATAGHARKKRK